ncbi:uncharacterized protein LOC132758679 [Ruditapes philippinarum]|uniref:uncharacterized protein LOC132758679 n=1 Tax=Ruditapes philippinarum TaxID=129788 RepID=UPI00295C2E23|nr:uncharacterized protein LOC132758679 [Ruditapes philippinarum]
MVIAKPGNANRKRKPLTPVFDDNRKISLHSTDVTFLQSLQNCPLSYLSTMPEETIQTDCGKQYLGSALAYQVPLMQPLELQGHKTDCGNLSMPFQPKIEVPDLVLNNSDKWAMLVKSQEEAEALEMSTRDQSHSTVWHKERENRITASTFGNFMIRKADLNDKFVRNTIQPFKVLQICAHFIWQK